MEMDYNSSNPYNFTYAVHESDEVHGELFMSRAYSPYYLSNWLFPSLIFRYLKNVRFRFTNRRDIAMSINTMKNITNTNALNDYQIKSKGIYYRIIDSAALYFSIGSSVTDLAHVAPIIYYNSLSIVSTVSSDSRRESSETLSVQGLPSSVWVLVCFSLLVVSGLASYFVFQNDTKNRRERPLKSWMSNVWIYAADILNNCAPGVANHRPVEWLLRFGWLLGVTFLIQFWSAGMKSDLLIDRTTFLDTLGDLLSKPELLCLIYEPGGDPFDVTKGDPRYRDYQKMKRYVNSVRDENSATILVNGSGVVIEQEKTVMNLPYDLNKKLKETKRKKYVGKNRFNGQYAHMLFNKRLPRAMKEEVDYLTSRLTETRQTEPRSRLEKFRSLEFIFDPTDNSASTMSWSTQNFNYLSPVFRMWIIGNSLATVVFCVECFRRRVSRRKPIKVAPHHSIGIWNRA